jgi:opacity protein-like surface antigen
VRRGAALALLAALVLSGGPAAAQDLGYRGWGVRGGVSDDPDQIVLGAQVDFGEFLPDLAFRPHADLGLGDDTTVLTLGLPVLYRLPIEGNFTVYGGGGVAVGLVDQDDEDEGRRDDDGTEVEIAPLLSAGIEWPVGRGDLGVELNAAGGDLPGVKLVAIWGF